MTEGSQRSQQRLHVAATADRVAKCDVIKRSPRWDVSECRNILELRLALAGEFAQCGRFFDPDAFSRP
jgi:hypothetical protein